MLGFVVKFHYSCSKDT